MKYSSNVILKKASYSNLAVDVVKQHTSQSSSAKTCIFYRPMSSIYATYTSGRDEQLFKNPEKFDPDRWSKDDIGAFAQLPFGFGPRSCYGNYNGFIIEHIMR